MRSEAFLLDRQTRAGVSSSSETCINKRKLVSCQKAYLSLPQEPQPAQELPQSWIIELSRRVIFDILIKSYADTMPGFVLFGKSSRDSNQEIVRYSDPNGWLQVRQSRPGAILFTTTLCAASVSSHLRYPLAVNRFGVAIQRCRETRSLAASRT